MNTLNYIPINRAMAELHLSKFKFYQLVQDGSLTIKKLGRKSYVSVAQINKMFEDAPEADLERA